MRIQTRSLEPKNRGPVRTLDISPNGRQLVLGQESDASGTSVNGNLSFWSTKSMQLLSEIQTGENQTVLAARYSPNGKTLAYVDTTLETRFYDLESKRVYEPTLENPYTRWISYSKNRDRLVIAGARTQVWDGVRNEIIWTLPGQVALQDSDSIPAVAALSPDGALVAVTGSEDRSVVIYNVDNGQIVKRLKSGPEHARWLEFDPFARYLAAISWFAEGSFLWNLKSGDQILPDIFEPEEEGHWSLRFHPKGDLVAVGTWVGYLEVIRLSDGEIMAIQQVHEGRLWDLAFTPGGEYLFSGGDDGMIYVSELIY